MTMQEMSTAVQYGLPIKIFILNNEYMGMVRQWQELLHGGRYSQCYSEALPDFVKLAEAYDARRHPLREAGRARRRDQGDDRRRQAGDLRLRGRPAENCFPMIPSGRAHNEMLLGDAARSIEDAITEEGKMLV